MNSHALISKYDKRSIFDMKNLCEMEGREIGLNI